MPFYLLFVGLKFCGLTSKISTLYRLCVYGRLVFIFNWILKRNKENNVAL